MAAAGEGTAPGHAHARALYDRYYANVYRYALAQLRSPEDAEDAVQTTFLRAFAAMQKGVVPVNEPAWLFTIARNACASSKLAWLRRRRVEAPRDLRLLPREPVAVEPPRLDGLDDALSAMPPRLREAFLLREWQGLSYAEIAERLDTSRSAVETLVFRARRFLAAELQALALGPAAWLRGLLSGGGGSALARGAGAAAVLAAGVATAVVVPPGQSPARTGPQRSVRAGDVPIGAALEPAAPRAVPARAAAAPWRRATPQRPEDVPAAGMSAATAPSVAAPTAAAATMEATASPKPNAAATVRTTTEATSGATETVALPTVPAVTTPVATTPALALPATTLPAVAVPDVPVPTLP